jgi:hypothetical protein
VTRKPKPGERLRLYGWAQKSRQGFSVACVVLDALDTRDTLASSLRPRATDCEVKVRLPDDSEVWVTRADLETE